ncbi:oxalate:formate antiporter [Plakobranchus ocellatus]|uniref:Oxalate:formate antiporter n=1 Tax=Plakobranchus ocellatus TaxID=259542 RepID=A0AAV4DVQ1_9GAST|nr:oxalate:formate antiporter [Plakobranchus ocellatus]
MAQFSFIWFYGNLSAYTDSYFRFSCYPECLDCNSQWVISLYVAGNFPGAFMVKSMTNRFGLKWTGIIAMVMANTALLGSAWSLQYSVAWTAVIYGTLLGTAAGITASVSMQVISGWAPERAAFFMATSTGMATMLSVLQNQIITAYVNPENLKPDAQIGPKTYFSQPEILDRVPDVVVILGAMTFGLQALGYLLTKTPPTRSKDSPNKMDDSLEVTNSNTDKDEERIPFEHANDLSSLEINHAVKHYGANVQTCKEIDLKEDSKTETRNISCINNCRNSVVQIDDERASKDIRMKELRSYTPKEMIRSPVFYALFFFGMALQHSLLLKSNFYKKFGLLYIRNDKYLTLVGTLIPITSSSSRIVIGTLLDKSILSFKDATMFGLSLNCVMCAFWYIAPQVNDILYMFVVLSLAAAQSLYYVVIPSAPLRLFGPNHISSNYGLVLSCTFIISFLTPVVNTALLHALGWQWVFNSGAIFSLLVLCLVALTKFNTQQ